MTKPRTVRIDDDLWNQIEGEKSEFIRDLLKQYFDGNLLELDDETSTRFYRFKEWAERETDGTFTDDAIVNSLFDILDGL